MAQQAWEVTREMFLDQEEVQRLVAYVRNAADQPAGRQQATARLDQLVIECLLFSGVRSSEFCRLTLADTFLGHGQMALAVRGVRGEDRTVYIPESLNDLILSYIKEIRPMFLPESIRQDDLGQALVFNEHRQPYERTGLYRRVVRVLSACGLGDRASVQLLRHTYGYLAYLRTGGNLLFVQRQLGHAHPMVTVVYAKFVNESYADMADMIPVEPTGIASTLDETINKGA